MDKRPLRMLSGAEIVDRGRNVTNCILPEVGIKEVIPNGSWLETKQIQTALEARKALVAVERIDKVGALSHAEWRDELRLAEVTQQVGGHWQYLGHTVNGTLFLLPEEALFLIETNCLLLKHNSITVSLQKAYSMLLDDSMTLTQYKVYASLSRVGYKVFRQGRLKPYDLKSKEITKIDTNGNENMIVLEGITKHKAIKSDQHNANISSEKLAISKNSPPDGSIVIIQSEMSDMQTNKTSLNKEPEMPENPTLPTNKTSLNKEPEVPENPTLPSNNTILNKEPEMPENTTPPSNKTALNKEPEIPKNDKTLKIEPEMSVKQTLPTGDATLNIDDTTLSMEIEMSENPTLPSNNTTLNKEPEMQENPTLSSNKTALNKEPEIPTNDKIHKIESEMSVKQTLPTGDATLNIDDTTLSMEIEMSENPTLPSNNTTLNKEPEMQENPTLPSNKTALNKEPEIPTNDKIQKIESEMSVKQTLPTGYATLNIDDTTLSMEIEMLENPTLPTNNTTLNKEPEMPENPTLPSNKTALNKEPEILTNDKVQKIESEMSVKQTLPTGDATLNIYDTTLSMEIEMSENPTLPTNNTTINKEPEMPENPTLPTNDKTLIIEPEMSVKPTLPTDDTTLNMEIEMSENPTLPTNDKTLKNEPEISVKPTLPTDDKTLKNKPEMSVKPTLPTDDTTLNMEIEMWENPTSDETLNKETTVSICPNSNEKISSNNGDYPGDKGVAGVPSIDKHGVIRLVTEEVQQDIEMEAVTSTALDSHTVTPKTDEIKSKNTDENKPKKIPNIYRVMLEKIKDRKILYSDPKTSQEIFNSIPDCFKTQSITVNVPKDDYLPRNIFLNNTSYVLNLKNIKSKPRKSTPTTVESRAMSRTLRNSRESETAAVPTPELPQFVPNMPLYQRPFGCFPNFRHRFQPFNQRPHFPRHNFNRHPHFYRMMHFIPQNFNANRPFMRPNLQYNQNQPKQRKRPRNEKYCNLRDIKCFSRRLKDFPMPPNNSINALRNLVSKYNEIYNENVTIGPNFEIVNAPLPNVETIELDDDEVNPKKPLLDSEKFDMYFVKVKAMAAKLMSLERKNQPTAKQKRAFKNLLKNFNETFNKEFYLDSNGAFIDKKLVVLDSSSDSDVIATDDIETKKKKRSPDGNCAEASKNKKRKLINPFNVFKTVNEGAGTSQSPVENIIPDIPVEIVSGDLTKYFDKNWLPNDGSFGEPNLCPKTAARYLWSDSQELYDFISWVDFNTWTDLKLSFCSQMEAGLDFEQDSNTDRSSKLKPILSQELSDEWLTSEKLRIINIDTEVQDTNLRIDFEVYNRDVQNFRKTDPPKPHFRVVCVEESSKFPSGAEVRGIHTRNEGNVTLVFAVVGVGSITYLQMNPKDVPVLRND